MRLTAEELEQLTQPVQLIWVKMSRPDPASSPSEQQEPFQIPNYVSSQRVTSLG